MADQEDDDEAVGYCRPPKKHQFKPGQSGNPKGRTRGARGVNAELRRELDELVEITENGRPKRIPKRRVVLKSLIAKAAKGDVRAAHLVVQYMIQLEGLEDQRKQPEKLSPADEQILDRLLSGAAPVPEDQNDSSVEDPMKRI